MARADDDVEFYGEPFIDEIEIREELKEEPEQSEERAEEEPKQEEEPAVIDYTPYEKLISEMKGAEA